MGYMVYGVCVNKRAGTGSIVFRVEDFCSVLSG